MYQKPHLVIILLFIIAFNSNVILGENPTVSYDHWQLKNISFTKEVADSTKSATNIVIAVIDSGIDFTHYDLGENLMWKNPNEILNGVDDDSNGYVDDINGWDFVDNDNDPSPLLENIDNNNNGIIDESASHGTAIAGIIAGQGIDVQGIVPNIQLLNIKVFNSDGKTFNLDEAWQYIYKLSEKNKEIKIINFSGVYGNTDLKNVNQTINNLLYMTNVSIVASSGNDYNKGIYDVSYPANHPDVISVGSIAEDFEISSFSQRGQAIDFVAPGENIFSLAIDNQINNNFDGTSFSAPFYSAALAYIYSIYQHSFLTISEIKNILINATTDLGELGWDEIFGFGLLNMTKLIKNISLPTNNNLNYSIEVPFASLLILVLLLRKKSF